MIDATYEPFATPAQWQKVLAYIENSGNASAAGRQLGFNHKTILTAVDQVRKKAAAEGHAPETSLKTAVAPGFRVDGYSEMQRNENGDPMWVIAKRDKSAIEQEERDAILQAFRDELTRAKPVPAVDDYAPDLMAAYAVGDHHFGMLACAEEAGGDYDLKIGEGLLIDALCHLVKAAPKCDTGLIMLVGDFMHYDSMETITPTHGHQLDADSRPYKMIRAAIRAIRSMIATALEHHREVRVIVEIGNHDLYSSLWLMECLSIFYEHEPRVTVDNSPANFHFFRWGNNLIGTHHGHRVKLQKLPMIMAQDCRKDWGETDHQHWFTGHRHQDHVIDIDGVTVEIVRILPPNDAHAQNGGYRSKRGMNAVIFHREYGCTGRYLVTPEMLQ